MRRNMAATFSRFVQVAGATLPWHAIKSGTIVTQRNEWYVSSVNRGAGVLFWINSIISLSVSLTRWIARKGLRLAKTTVAFSKMSTMNRLKVNYVLKLYSNSLWGCAKISHISMLPAQSVTLRYISHIILSLTFILLNACWNKKVT